MKNIVFKKTLVGVFVVLGVAGFLLCYSYSNNSSLDSVGAVVASVLVDLTNRDRVQNGLGVLQENSLLNTIAQAKADDMASHGYFAHESPSGMQPWDWFDKIGYDFLYAGENLAVDFSDSEDIQRAWMNSEKHRENVLNKDFIEVGIGIAQGLLNGRNTIFVVQEFGTPMGNDKDISVDFKDSKSFESQVVDLDLAEVQANILEVTKLFCSSIGDMFSSPLCL